MLGNCLNVRNRLSIFIQLNSNKEGFLIDFVVSANQQTNRNQAFSIFEHV